MAFQLVPAQEADTGTKVIDVAALAVVAKEAEPNREPVKEPVKDPVPEPDTENATDAVLAEFTVPAFVSAYDAVVEQDAVVGVKVMLVAALAVVAYEAEPNNDPVKEPVKDPVLTCMELDTNPTGMLFMTFQLVPAKDAEIGTKVIDVAALAVVAKLDDPCKFPVTDPVNDPEYPRTIVGSNVPTGGDQLADKAYELDITFVTKVPSPLNVPENVPVAAPPNVTSSPKYAERDTRNICEPPGSVPRINVPS